MYLVSKILEDLTAATDLDQAKPDNESHPFHYQIDILFYFKLRGLIKIFILCVKKC